MNEVTGKEEYKMAAWHWDERLEAQMLVPNSFDHDVGFHFLPTAVAKYRITGDQDARRRGLFAANFMTGRFNLNGRFIRA